MRVGVVVLQPFVHQGCEVQPGRDVWLDPLDAAVKAQEGLVSLLHGDRGTYATREMTADTTGPLSVHVSVATDPPLPPLKRKRGRPRKVR